MLQTIYDFDLIRVYLDSSMSHHIAEELARTYPKRVFGGIKTELVSLQNFEDICKVPICSDTILLFTTMSSIYTTIFLPICASNILVIIL